MSHFLQGNRRSLELTFLDLFEYSSLVYVDACLSEIYRLSSITQFGVPRTTTEDLEFRGYSIPKHTIIMGNFYGVHHELGGVWGDEDPFNFHPERFLTPDGKSPVKYPNLMPFSTGKRVCPGNFISPIKKPIKLPFNLFSLG